MSLSPNDVRNFEFPNQMRGYDKDEVDNFREQVAAALEEARQENLKLTMEMDSLKSQLSGLKQFEETIKNAAIDARRNADLTISNAKQEAELMVKKARAEAEQELSSRTSKTHEIEEQITKLQLAKKSYYAKLRSLIQSHLELIDDIGQGEQKHAPVEDRIEVTDSSEVESKRRETIATVPAKDKGIRTEEARQEEADEDESLADEASAMLKSAIKDDDDNVVSAEAEPEESLVAEEEPAPEPPKPSETPGIDPELAAALENYQNAARKQQEEMDAPAKQAAPAAKGMVETNARAEDVPPGFVTVGEEKLMEQAATDTGPVSAQQKQSMEPNPVKAAPKKSNGPEDIAKELDEVVAKFEEEMDKAAKS